jgi:hypothetical protein
MGNNINNTTGSETPVDRWQKKLLPWFIIMPTALIGVFIFLATQQLVRFSEKLQTRPDSTLMNIIIPPDKELRQSNELFHDQKYLLLVTLAHLEQESTYRRYNQGAMLLMSRIFTMYLGFFTGMILAIVGAIFVIGKIREDSSQIDATVNEMMKFSIISSSPGIVFGILGTVLMLATILKHNEITVQDSPLYLNANTIMATELINFSKKDSLPAIDTTLFKTETLWTQNKK